MKVARRTWMLAGAPAFARARCAVSTFAADVTPPLGSPLFTKPARSIVDPLQARGLVLEGAGKPVVLLCVDWCEIRNNSYDLWRSELARAVGTVPERVLLSAVHPHDAPYTDSGAQALLAAGELCDPAFEREAMARVVSALRGTKATGVTHVGTGKARVAEVASNRRYVMPGGRISWGRLSATRDAALRALPEGLVDPWLRTLSFWNGEKAVAALSVYSTHPMSYYGQGDVTCDFVGLARNQVQREMPGVFHLYGSGASGDTIAGKYNDGDPANRWVLAGKLASAMKSAFGSTERVALTGAGFRCAKLRFAARESDGFRLEQMRAAVADAQAPLRRRREAALGLSWRARLAEQRPVDVPALHLGPAKLLLLPAESFVQYQLWAQEYGPFVTALGYGECAPGYIPTAQDVREGYDDAYSWVDLASAEAVMRKAMGEALRG